MLNNTLIKAYREARKPWEGMGGFIGHTKASSALRQARAVLHAEQTLKRWDELNGWCFCQADTPHPIDPSAKPHTYAGCGAVRIERMPDEFFNIEDLEGDVFNLDVNTDINRSTLAKEQREFRQRVERDGVWGYLAQCWVDGEWETVDSVWGFVGDDFEQSGYDTDLMDAAMQHAFNVAQRQVMRDAQIDMYGV
jgi:hypothetical protein